VKNRRRPPGLHHVLIIWFHFRPRIPRSFWKEGCDRGEVAGSLSGKSNGI
jgi:hypothetical protein